MRIVIISNNDWDGLWYQRQQFAKMYAQRGHSVLFINKTLQRFPILKDFKDRFWGKNALQIKKNQVPERVSVISIYTLPPISAFRWINKRIICHSLKNSPFLNCDLLITYIPSYTAVDIIDTIKPRKTAYINVHNYDADDVVNDLLKAEKQLCRTVDYLFADSDFNRDRLLRLSGHGTVFFSKPGVDATNFFRAFRGNESSLHKTIGYFGGIGSHLDLNLYNRLAEKYDVVFIGSCNREDIAQRISSRIKLLPPVSNDELPYALRDVDILTVCYHSTNYVQGVIPAKIFECIATLKPTIIVGIKNVDSLSECIYTCAPDVEAINDVINHCFPEDHKKIEYRRKVAIESDWETRFDNLNRNMHENV